MEDRPNSQPAGRFVFISHSSRDTWVARQIAHAIAQTGAVPFLDEANNEVGADFEQEILTFLEKADELVVLLTPWSLERPFVWAEIGAAWGRRIPIVALLHGISASDVQSRPGIPTIIKRRDLLDLNDIETYIEQLAGRVGGSNQ